MNNVENVNTKKVVIICVFMVFMLAIFMADDWQQNRFKNLRQGYAYMEQGQYDEAEILFEKYLKVDSEIYWSLIETINDESYSRANVKECMEKISLLQGRSSYEYE